MLFDTGAIPYDDFEWTARYNMLQAVRMPFQNDVIGREQSTDTLMPPTGATSMIGARTLNKV